MNSFRLASTRTLVLSAALLVGATLAACKADHGSFPTLTVEENPIRDTASRKRA